MFKVHILWAEVTNGFAVVGKWTTVAYACQQCLSTKQRAVDWLKVLILRGMRSLPAFCKAAYMRKLRKFPDSIPDTAIGELFGEDWGNIFLEPEVQKPA